MEKSVFFKAGPQAPSLHFRAPFKVRQGLPKHPYSCFSQKLGTRLPHSQSLKSGGPSTRSRCPAGGRTAIGGGRVIWTSGSQRGPTALRPRASALLSRVALFVWLSWVSGSGVRLLSPRQAAPSAWPGFPCGCEPWPPQGC